MQALGFVLLVVTGIFGVPVHAADYPERNIAVIVPFPPGGASDVTARLVTAKLAERVKQTVVFDNRAGANGALGATALKQAPADGYTLLVGSIGVFAINPALIKDLKYDPQRISICCRSSCAHRTCWWRIPIFPPTTFAS